MHIFIFGAGYSGQAFAREMGETAEGIAGTTRTADNFTALQRAGIAPFLFDGTSAPAEIVEELSRTTHLVVSISPAKTGDPVLLHFGNLLRDAAPALEWIGYLSTVGVYGDHGGEWVSEDTPPRPVSARSIERLAAERSWQELASAHSVPLAILRLSGIYGPGRNAFINLENGTARRLIKPGQMFNRIHVDDIAGSLALLASRSAEGIYNITDDEPAPPQDVVTCAAEMMGVEPPPEVTFETAELSPMARSFYSENKRVSNAAIKKLGYRFRHPGYRQGLTSLWREGNWKG
ncbi:SDR family NAD(P)-dependent oxidoreductase [Phyllobacterium salinisoli]|uniref:SDR family NAD(P)-dependent oxidoreductase n=1 Tax=Phyllobacterium salinisoli TaxID=1899321 RepID=A0A368K5Z1_9HYPH|nr:SDR family oxidoreductase [Phyllobacterium salinisoli]RCS24806.1 SDR family NAD(P)-dependent oxidoreductase [Phyllobacterium salinisoli]